ncbi:replication protein A 70 kDa DNA-binding subunit B-like [Arabidopsis lyrata subsp. lyrata]|uniref:replication protein A 70 kDa DNA-binding subunit B-like n=1 Tax=Arabidopsis lyrata subsp. lyrata TaxID=81972 RepID=UPI000A29B59F|nr:replication protein A 70 kDa DNA-binding subunit B-like [Arabidopsis lyrata subsp. lyrata]XP_020882641.1 replication protein A 70 kDa DNA-binding subunit B [Arabidopsis lyrata subsp. lyrata]XP_020889705.1 replication protein A 70 kDa DNA-binding subunit B-like [Arabidopsis lyrata subsp. lyrata]|eukprot:XP_020879663.1 replication protein A 70 kDa DNA-binding subunit B-like [Arabidopsis lyrata subsp. lyrata]
MAQAIAYLDDIKPYKTTWRVQVRVLHTWKTFTTKFGETFDMVLSDVKGKKIHASVKREHLNRFEKLMVPGEWKAIENFGLTYSTGQFKATDHRYKMGFMAQTRVVRMDPLSDSYYLSLTPFNDVLTAGLNQNYLIDVVGQIVNVGEMETIDVQNKPTKKIDFELRDHTDERLPCTLWGSFAEQVFSACEASAGEMVICLVRYAKIKTYKDVRSISNAFNTSQILINPDIPEIVAFKESLPKDGLALTLLESKPKQEMIELTTGDFYLQFPKKTIKEVAEMFDTGRVKVLCTIYDIDRDWSWYYIACRKCNKKVSKVVTTSLKPQFWCDSCRSPVCNVVARYKLHVKVMDSTGEMKLMLFDSMASEIVGCPANSLLDGSFDEFEDPENLPDAIRHLTGKTYQYLVCVENENVWNGLDTYKVSRVLANDCVGEEDLPDDSIDQTQGSLLLTYSGEPSETTTPSSKRSSDSSLSPADNSSTTKKLCLESINVVKIKQEKGVKTNEDKVDGVKLECVALKQHEENTDEDKVNLDKLKGSDVKQKNKNMK